MAAGQAKGWSVGGVNPTLLNEAVRRIIAEWELPRWRWVDFLTSKWGVMQTRRMYRILEGRE